MKKIVFVAALNFLFNAINAQETIKVGVDKTITCTGSFIAEVQNYFSDGKPSSKSRAFVDVQKDSAVFHTALIDAARENQVVFRYAVAKKDIDQGVWGFEVTAVKDNGAPFQMLSIKSIDGNSVISEQKFSRGDVEVSDPTNRVHIYFNADKEADAKAWAEKIKKLIQ